MDGDAAYVDDPLEAYISEVQRIPPLDRAEEIECIGHVRAGDEFAETAGKRLLEANLHVVISVANRYRNDQVQILDSIQKGNDALLRAVETLKEMQFNRFPAHAVSYIERAIADAIARPSDHPMSPDRSDTGPSD